MCGGRLFVRADRPSFPVVYTEDMGTIPGTHFRKYCENQSKGCHFTQHYGFCSDDETNAVVYDKECFKLPYFMLTNMTVFQITSLQFFTAELLIDQVSYKQKADIYNYQHGYESKLRKNLSGRSPSSQLLEKYVCMNVVNNVFPYWLCHIFTIITHIFSISKNIHLHNLC